MAGKSSGNDEKCLEDQLGDAKIAVGQSETELKQLQNQISHVEKELKEKKSQLLSTSQKAAAIENELNAKRKEVGTVEKKLESLSYDETLMDSLQKVPFVKPHHTVISLKVYASLPHWVAECS